MCAPNMWSTPILTRAILYDVNYQDINFHRINICKNSTQFLKSTSWYVSDLIFEDLKAYVQMMASVAFCPLAYARTAWLAIQLGAPNIPRVDELIDYFSANNTYSLELYFNQHQPRINNHVEGWHSRMKKVIGKPHPNIFAWDWVHAKRSGATARPQRRRMREEKWIQILFNRFNVGSLTLDEYLASILLIPR